MGKRGGARVIYFTRLAKGEIDNVPNSVLKQWKEAYDA